MNKDNVKKKKQKLSRSTRRKKNKKKRIAREQKYKLFNLIYKKKWNNVRRAIEKNDTTLDKIKLQKQIDQLCNKGIIKLNKASRWKSRLMKL